MYRIYLPIISFLLQRIGDLSDGERFVIRRIIYRPENTESLFLQSGGGSVEKLFIQEYSSHEDHSVNPVFFFCFFCYGSDNPGDRVVEF